MPKVFRKPSVIKSAGNKVKIIEEFFGRVNSKTKKVSIAKMTSPAGWREPAQTPEFDEYTLVLEGELKVETKRKKYFIKSGEAILARAGEKVCYSTPKGATYIAICLPAFSIKTVHREE